MKQFHFHVPGKFSWSLAIYAASVVFLFIPLLVLIIFSFNGGSGGAWGGFSLGLYGRLFSFSGFSGTLWEALGNTLLIALVSAFCSTVIGTLGAIGVSWYRFRLRGYVQGLAFLPLIIPEIVLGVSLLTYFSLMQVPKSLFTVIVAHITFSIPFVYLMVTARLDEFDKSVIEAAHDLGATERQTMARVIIPMTMPGIISGFITAITLSLEDFITTYMVAGPGSPTLPAQIYTMLPKGGLNLHPEVYALATIMIAGTIFLALAARNFLKYIAAK